MTDLPEACDFCDLVPDGGLVEVRFGPLPQPSPVTSQGITNNRAIGRHSSEKFDALITAIRKMDGLEFEINEMVREVKEVGGKQHFGKVTDGGEMYFDSEVRDDKTAAELRYRPNLIESEPDAKLCQNCVEMLE